MPLVFRPRRRRESITPLCIRARVTITSLGWRNVSRLFASRDWSPLCLTGVAHMLRLNILCWSSMFIPIGLSIAWVISWAWRGPPLMYVILRITYLRVAAREHRGGRLRCERLSCILVLRRGDLILGSVRVGVGIIVLFGRFRRLARCAW